MKIVGVGDCGFVRTPGEMIKTLALGSCLGVIVISRKIPLIGLLHVQLPESQINPQMARDRPAMFADTGVPLLLAPFWEISKNPRDVLVKLVGGAQIMDPQNTFSIGKRNYLAVKKLLWANRLWPASEDIGGVISRSVTVVVGSDDVLLHSPGRQDWTI